MQGVFSQAKETLRALSGVRSDATAAGCVLDMVSSTDGYPGGPEACTDFPPAVREGGRAIMEGSTTNSDRARSFDAAAAPHAANRPSYPPALLDAIEELSGRPLAGARVADVGAGTGIATALLDGRGARVAAVEPGDGWPRSLRLGPAAMAAGGPGRRQPAAAADRLAGPDHVRPVMAPGLTPPARSPRRAASCAPAGGALALWWNDSRPARGVDRRPAARWVLDTFGEGQEDHHVAAYDADARLRAELPAGVDFRTRQVEWEPGGAL
ncbi:hypothetical protein SMICM304S_02929 [Streptomyces microflavus]